MIDALRNKERTIAVIGLGYVGLPLALAMARHFKVLGYDINAERVKMMQEGRDPSNELSEEDFEGRDISFSSNQEDLRQASFYIVAVPTPVDQHKVPDLGPVNLASDHIGRALKKGDYVVYESTVYPGCTEEDCVPILEARSGLRMGSDFKVGYSPERINPGDKAHRVEQIKKVVSACDEDALEVIAEVYGDVISAGVFKAKSIKVAEAAKVIENTQRDLNISFVNELSIIFDKMNISTQDVLEAASTKWNFLNFSPGLVGGHCIGVDPYYLLHKSKELGYDPQVILSGRRVNDEMPVFIAKKLVQMLIQKGKHPRDCKVLVMGITFKENVTDIRNSKVADLVHEIQGYSVKVETVDPYASPVEVRNEYDLELAEGPQGPYDAVIISVAHDVYRDMPISEIRGLLSQDKPVLMDLKGIFSHSVNGDLTYWSL
jgi:UDP-N-acetyl-D-galactosamine dehydrogenase